MRMLISALFIQAISPGIPVLRFTGIQPHVRPMSRGIFRTTIANCPLAVLGTFSAKNAQNRPPASVTMGRLHDDPSPQSSHSPHLAVFVSLSSPCVLHYPAVMGRWWSVIASTDNCFTSIMRLACFAVSAQARRSAIGSDIRDRWRFGNLRVQRLYSHCWRPAISIVRSNAVPAYW